MVERGPSRGRWGHHHVELREEKEPSQEAEKAHLGGARKAKRMWNPRSQERVPKGRANSVSCGHDDAYTFTQPRITPGQYQRQVTDVGTVHKPDSNFTSYTYTRVCVRVCVCVCLYIALCVYPAPQWRRRSAPHYKTPCASTPLPAQPCSHASRLAATNLSSSVILLFHECYIDGIIQYITF